MTRKALVIVGLAVIIAATSGVAFASNGGLRSAGSVKETTAIAQNIDYNSDEEYSYGEYEENQSAEGMTDPEEPNEGETAAEGEEPSDAPEEEENAPDPPEQTDQRELLAHYGIIEVLDHNSGEAVSPQVAFGKYYRSCYFELYSDSTFALCLSPSTGAVQTGSYSIGDDLMQVDFGGDRETSFKLTRGADGDIETIIFSDNEYIIYFG